MPESFEDKVDDHFNPRHITYFEVSWHSLSFAFSSARGAVSGEELGCRVRLTGAYDACDAPMLYKSGSKVEDFIETLGNGQAVGLASSVEYDTVCDIEHLIKMPMIDGFDVVLSPCSSKD